MALLKKTKKSEEKVDTKKEKPSLVLTPRITEKATTLADKNVYVFNVSGGINKLEIKKEIKRLYKVTPEKITVVTIQPETVFVRGKFGTKSGGKKAYVYLKKGDKIQFV